MGNAFWIFVGRYHGNIGNIVWILWIHIHGFLTRRYRTYRIFHDISILVLLHWDIIGMIFNQTYLWYYGDIKMGFLPTAPRSPRPPSSQPPRCLEPKAPFAIRFRSVFFSANICAMPMILVVVSYGPIFYIYIYILFGIIIWFYMVWNLM